MNNGLHEISTCEVCMNKELEPVLDLGLHPMCDDLVPVGDDRVCPEYQSTFCIASNAVPHTSVFRCRSTSCFLRVITIVPGLRLTC